MKWSQKSINSFNTFKIDGVSIPGRRAFKYKKKLYILMQCAKDLWERGTAYLV